MFPNNNSRGISRRGPSDFSHTMIPGGGGNSPFPPTRNIGQSMRDPRSSHSSRTNQSSAPSAGGMSTVIRPGQPHWFGCRADRRLGPVSTLCRCNNPDSHGDAWSMSGWFDDINRQPITQEQLMNRMLDHYGKATINRDEEVAAYPILLDFVDAASMLRHHHGLTRSIQRGDQIYLSDNPESLTFHNGDGHVQNHVSENGLRTTFGQPFPGLGGGSSGGSGRGGGSRGLGSRR